MPSTPQDFRRLALALPLTEQRRHMNHPDFRVAGKIFATLAYPNKQRGMVKLTPVQQQEFVEAYPEVFNPVTGAWGRKGCTSVLLAKAHKRVLKEAILAAWRNHAPRELALNSLNPKYSRHNTKLGRRKKVVLLKAEPSLLKGLPRKDRKAIQSIVGKRVRLEGYDEHGRAELHFREADGTLHFIWVRPQLIRVPQ